jgi:glucose-6-phosphate-specific signal transduction histidine kinase
VQETLTNITRHAKATAVHIEMVCGDDELVLRVQDNGVGLPKPPSRRRVSHGLMGMRERCQMLGGTIEVGNAPEGGACITIRLPLLAQLQTDADGELGDLDLPSAHSGHPGSAGGDAAPVAACV